VEGAHVLGLDVAVDDAHSVQVLDGAHQLYIYMYVLSEREGGREEGGREREGEKEREREQGTLYPWRAGTR
jgi:hypothetical protein